MNQVEKWLRHYYKGELMSFSDLEKIDCSNKWENIISYMETKKVDDPLNHTVLGLMYLYGTGVRKNIELAIKNLEKGSSHGHVTAKLYLAGMYKNGIGTLPDMEKSEKLRKEAETNICAYCQKIIASNGSRFKNYRFHSMCWQQCLLNDSRKRQNQIRPQCHQCDVLHLLCQNGNCMENAQNCMGCGLDYIKSFYCVKCSEKYQNHIKSYGLLSI